MKPLKTRPPRKLSIHKTTLRHLGDVDLANVVGGVTTVTSEYASELKPCQPERRTRIC